MIKRTGIPSVLFLMGFGVLLRPVFHLAEPTVVIKLAPYFGTIALLMSLVLLLLGKIRFGIEAEAESLINGIDFDETFLHGMLSFLLFAGALHVNLDDLLEQKWFIGT